ncbi:MAG TPA: ABC transporter permease [Dehalococcoidia bacterium]
MALAHELPGEYLEERRQPGPVMRALRRLLRKKLALLALAIIGVVYLSGILAPVAAPYHYDEQNLDRALEGPSRDHPLGTDRLGRDMLSRTMYAARTTVIITVATLVTGSLALGVGLGLLAGYRGGWVDGLIMRVADVFFALPGLLILLLITSTVRPRVEGLVLRLEAWTGADWIRSSGLADYLLIFGALSVFSWVGLARLVRSQVLALRETEYVVAAEAMGASTARILWWHLLPGVVPTVVVLLSLALGAAAASEVALSWIGVGVQPPTPSFGIMLRQAAGLVQFREHPHLLLVPGAVVGVLIFAFNLLGDALNDALNPRAR